MSIDDKTEQDVSWLLHRARERRERETLSEIFFQIQTFSTQPPINSEISNIEGNTPELDTLIGRDYLMECLLAKTGDKKDNTIDHIVTSAASLCKHTERLQQIGLVLTPVMDHINGITIADVDRYIEAKFYNKDKSDRYRAQALEHLVNEFAKRSGNEQGIREAYRDLATLRAAKKTLNIVWCVLTDAESSSSSAWVSGLNDKKWQSLPPREKLVKTLVKLGENDAQKLNNVLILLSSPLIRDPFLDPEVYSFSKMPFVRRKDSDLETIDITYLVEPFPHARLISDYWMIAVGDRQELALPASLIQTIKPPLVEWNKQLLTL